MKKSDIYKLTEILIKKTKENVAITESTQSGSNNQRLTKVLDLYLKAEWDPALTPQEMLYFKKYILPLKDNKADSNGETKLCSNETNLNIVSVIFFAVHLSKSHLPYYSYKQKDHLRSPLDADDWIDELRIDCNNAIDFYHNESLRDFNKEYPKKKDEDYRRILGKIKSDFRKQESIISTELFILLSISYKLTMLHYSLKKKEIDKTVNLLRETIEKIDELPIDDQHYFIAKNISSINKLTESMELIKSRIKNDALKVIVKYKDGSKTPSREDENILAKYCELNMMQSTGVEIKSDSQDNINKIHLR